MQRLLLCSLFALLACGGEEKKVSAPPPEPAKVAAPTPPPPPPVAAVAGPYTPDDLAKAAYAAAKAAGADANTNPKAGDAAAIAAGKATYEAKCVACHGASGAGDGVAGMALPQKAANFTSKDRWEATSIGVKHWISQNGVMGTGMAPLGLTPDQSWEVLSYIDATFTRK